MSQMWWSQSDPSQNKDIKQLCKKKENGGKNNEQRTSGRLHRIK
jgi:hypothetical protein